MTHLIISIVSGLTPKELEHPITEKLIKYKTKDELLDKLIDFYRENGLIPTIAIRGRYIYLPRYDLLGIFSPEELLKKIEVERNGKH